MRNHNKKLDEVANSSEVQKWLPLGRGREHLRLCGCGRVLRRVLRTLAIFMLQMRR